MMFRIMGWEPLGKLRASGRRQHVVLSVMISVTVLLRVVIVIVIAT